jgi:hypothetical protein
MNEYGLIDFLEIVNGYVQDNDKITFEELTQEIKNCTIHAEQIAISIMENRKNHRV